jgi:hypothetical protein
MQITLFIAIGIAAVYVIAYCLTRLATAAPAIAADLAKQPVHPYRHEHCEHCGSGELRRNDTGELLMRFGIGCGLCTPCTPSTARHVQCSRCGDQYLPDTINGRAVTASGCCYTCNTELIAGQ